ncbi:MAG TPA: CHAT domain-containing tetratricopeptide repeat protein [Thermoanaerobaculia bacterium]|nr:CHAT domain-containing tetratricopeptide repeat protein [Thermoanaerobaculia bacterium]
MKSTPRSIRSSLRLSFYYAILLSVVCVAVLRGQSTAEPLTPDISVTRQIAQGEEHTYEIALKSGDLVTVIADQQGVDLSLHIGRSNGEESSRMDHRGAFFGIEQVSMITRAADTARITVRALKRGHKAGGCYTIRAEVRGAVPEDEDAIEAERQFAEGVRRQVEGTPQAIGDAVKRFQTAADLWRRLNDRRRLSDALDSLGSCFALMAENPSAIASLEEAVAIRKLVGSPREEADSLTTLARVYNRVGARAKAIECLEAASKKQVDVQMQAWIATAFALVYENLGESSKALDAYLKALPLWRTIGDRGSEAFTLSNLAHYSLDRGEYQRAIDYGRQALSIYEKLDSRGGRGLALLTIGDSYASWGMYDQALEHLRRALEFQRASADRLRAASTLMHIGTIHLQQNHLENALDAYLEALPVLESAAVPEALSFLLMKIGRTYMRAGKLDTALDFYEAALRMDSAEDTRGRSDILKSLADLHVASNRPEKAIGCYNEAIDGYRSISLRPGEASALYGSARAEAQIGHLHDAQREIQGALEIMEDVRGSMINREARASYSESTRSLYDFSVDLLMQLHRSEPRAGYDAAAFHASERARARSLLEVLAEGRAKIRQNVAPDLLEREQTIRQRLSSTVNQMMRLRSGNRRSDESESIAREMKRLNAEYEIVQEEIRKTSPRYASLTQPRPLAVSDLQRFLGPDTILLEYFLGDSRSFLWAVTHNALVTFELPKREEIENAARRLYETLSSAQKRAPASRTLTLQLGTMLLGPVADAIENKRLVVVADGALQYIPFTALRLPETVIAHHEVVYAPSASALASLRTDASSRNRPSMTLAVFADPVFDKNDERVTGIGVRSPRIEPVVRDTDTVMPLDIAVRDAGIDGSVLARLPFTRREANAILPLVPRRKRKAALDFDASRATAFGKDLAKYRIVHFATHALIDSRRPEFSGIVLSLVDTRGREQDGFLSATEIFNLKLGADLVILSACRTALGQDVRSEGLVGLTRGFMYAGVPRVVASLWKVDDAATAELMRLFYEGMLGPKKLRPAAALRQAQMALARTPQWSAPYYWAAFVLQGEWN